MIAKLKGWPREYSGYFEIRNLGPDTAHVRFIYTFERLFIDKVFLSSGRWDKWNLGVGEGVLIPIMDWFYGIGFCLLTIEIVGLDDDDGLHIVSKSYGVCNNRNVYFFIRT